MKHRVFTIFELLVVVAIISILLAEGQFLDYRLHKILGLQEKLSNQKEYNKIFYHQV